MIFDGLSVNSPRNLPVATFARGVPQRTPRYPGVPLGPLSKIGTLKKTEKQKCDLQFAPTELNDFLDSFIFYFIFPGGPGGKKN